MGENIRASGRTIKCMDEECSDGRRGGNTMGSTWMTRRVEEGHLRLLMVLTTLESGTKANSTGREGIRTRTATQRMGIGLMANCNDLFILAILLSYYRARSLIVIVILLDSLI